MPVERRGWVIAVEIGSTGNGRNPILDGRRQPSCGGTSRMTRECQVRIWCSGASCHSSGGESRHQRSPVAVVVISSNGEGNRSVGSLEVKALEGRACRSDPYRGASNLAGRSKCVNREAPKYLPRVKRIAGRIGSAELLRSRRRPCRHRSSGLAMIELPGVIESGMPRRNGQRKPGTTRGSPRRSRTAKASRISRHAVKMRCAHEWDGWGRLSNDGARQHNSGKSEDPWSCGDPTSWRCTSNPRPGSVRDNRWIKRCTKDGCKLANTPRMSGADLSSRGSREGAI